MPACRRIRSLIDKKNARRYDDCLKYTIVSGKKALQQAGLDKDGNASAFGQLDLTRCGVLVGSGMGGLSIFQDGESGVGYCDFVLVGRRSNSAWGIKSMVMHTCVLGCNQN